MSIRVMSVFRLCNATLLFTLYLSTTSARCEYCVFSTSGDMADHNHWATASQRAATARMYRYRGELRAHASRREVRVVRLRHHGLSVVARGGDIEAALDDPVSAVGRRRDA